MKKNIIIGKIEVDVFGIQNAREEQWQNMDQIRLKAMAKINLGLDVVRRREDGYHEVRMIMQNIHLYDTIFMKKLQGNEIKVKTNLHFLPTNENNLVYQAAKLLKDEFKIETGVLIELQKYILFALGKDLTYIINLENQKYH